MNGDTDDKAASPLARSPGSMFTTGRDYAQVNERTRVRMLPAARRPTQEEQNEFDDEKRRQAMKELVASWLDRLQLISVITTFFASTEAVMLGITTREPTNQSAIEQAANATFLGALVLHASSAIVSFLGAFFLINYKVHEARKEEFRVEGGVIVEPLADVEKPPVVTRVHTFASNTDPLPGPIAVNELGDPPVWSTNPHLIQVGPFHRQPPTNVLERCHSLSVFLASVGFALAMTGIGCFAWARHARSASIFCTVWIAISVTLSVGSFIVPNMKLVGPKLPKRRRITRHPVI